jgi:hypothetical protein
VFTWSRHAPQDEEAHCRYLVIGGACQGETVTGPAAFRTAGVKVVRPGGREVTIPAEYLQRVTV